MMEPTNSPRASPGAREARGIPTNLMKEISMRTDKLNTMKAKHRARVAEIQAYPDHTPEAKARILREETEKFDAVRRAEEDRVTHALDAEVERAYKAAHGPGRAIDTTGELRLARLREEVRDELDTKRLDPIRGYEDALRAGDTERAGVIGKVGARYLDGFRRVRLGELVEQNMPERDRKARETLAALEREREDLQLGLSLSRMSRSA